MGNVFLQERRKRLAVELAKLPEEQRQVLEMAFYQGMTQSEISSLTGTPLGTVKTRTLLAMRKLRKALSEELEDLL
jgi:RNA polymerase sigma-70 factor (ECF subfamily)